MSIGVVLNPRSRRNLRDPRAASRLARALGDQGVVREARSIGELYRIAEDFKRLRIDVLGGSTLPQIAFLRGGTMNTVANAVGVRKGRPEGLLGRLIRAYASRAAQPLINVERHVMHVGDHYGFLFGTGAVYGYLAEYYRDGEPTPLVAAKTLLRGVGSTLVRGEMVRRMAAPFRGSVALDDGTTWPVRDYLAIAGGTIDQIGLNFRPFYRFDERPNAFHLLGIHATPMRFVRELPRILRGEPMRPGKAVEATPSGATISSADGVVRYMVDGDLHEAQGPLRVTIGPRVKIVVNL